MAKLIQRVREGSPTPQKSPNRIPIEDIFSVVGIPDRSSEAVITGDAEFKWEFPEIRIGPSWRLIPSALNIVLENWDGNAWTTKATWTP